MVLISGSCNNCGQCCGCPTAPNRASAWPRNWPAAVRTWDPAVRASVYPVFVVTGHPGEGGPQAGVIRLGNRNYRWIWVPSAGLCADAPPWGDPASYEPQCPLLGPVQGDGTYPCAVIGTQWEAIATQIGCRWLPETMEDEHWAQWIADHPACGYTATPA